MAVAQKHDGKIYISIIPAHINNTLKREHYKLPTLHGVLGYLKDARFYTSDDVTEAYYWHIRLDEQSRFLIIISPVGIFRWLRKQWNLSKESLWCH